jgi:hypothetical protein
VTAGPAKQRDPGRSVSSLHAVAPGRQADPSPRSGSGARAHRTRGNGRSPARRSGRRPRRASLIPAREAPG